MSTSTPLAHVVHYTDAYCPWAWNAEPALLHIRWRYGDQLSWEHNMVGLAETPDVYTDRGYTIEMMNSNRAEMAARLPMPIGDPYERIAATGPACRAVVAAQLYAPQQADRLLRTLRVAMAYGQLIDEPAVIAAAAGAAGIDSDLLAQHAASDDVAAIYDEQLSRARRPSPAALAQNARLADWENGRRYTCPSLEIIRTSDGTRAAAPGFQPWQAYELALANLLPDAQQRPDPLSAEEVLKFEPRWPLATAEVAQLRGIDRDEATAELETLGATRHPIADDAFWSAD